MPLSPALRRALILVVLLFVVAQTPPPASAAQSESPTTTGLGPRDLLRYGGQGLFNLAVNDVPLLEEPGLPRRRRGPAPFYVDGNRMVDHIRATQAEAGDHARASTGSQESTAGYAGEDGRPGAAPSYPGQPGPARRYTRSPEDEIARLEKLNRKARLHGALWAVGSAAAVACAAAGIASLALPRRRRG